MPIKFGLWLDEDDDYQITNLKSAWVLGTLRESIPRLFNGGMTTMTTHCAPACSQVLPVKPQGVWARGIEVWAGSHDRRNQEFQRWGSLGPSIVMKTETNLLEDLRKFLLGFMLVLEFPDFSTGWTYIILKQYWYTLISLHHHGSCRCPGAQ